jgi:3-phenylpropionate/trans-cinnamate dioxygenase ferredoxin reductase component
MRGKPASDRIVIVGASLAGLWAAVTLRKDGFDGNLTIIGDEPDPPYDRPPLTKQVLIGWVPPDHTVLPQLAPLGDAHWRLGTPAARLDRNAKEVVLADSSKVPYDQVLIATGMRNRCWPKADEAGLAGVCGIRTWPDAARLIELLDAGVNRVVVIGAGFTGSEVASACQARGIDVTVVERCEAPLAGALGGVIGDFAASLQRSRGVDLRCGVTVEALEGSGGRFEAVRLSDGSTVRADVAVIALGGVPNTEWLADSGLAAGRLGVAADAGCRAFAVNAMVTDDVFVAGDVARFVHPLFDYQLITLEHWENAVVGAQVAARNMICPPQDRRPHVCVPTFWSEQFGVNIKSVGVPCLADEVLITQGSPEAGAFAVAYGTSDGRIVAAATFNQAQWLEHYRRLIEQARPLPAPFHDRLPDKPQPARFPFTGDAYHNPTVIVTGHSPTEMDAIRRPVCPPAERRAP